jgi:hypothetical protein
MPKSIELMLKGFVILASGTFFLSLALVGGAGASSLELGEFLALAVDTVCNAGAILVMTIFLIVSLIPVRQTVRVSLGQYDLENSMPNLAVNLLPDYLWPQIMRIFQVIHRAPGSLTV